MLVLGRNERWKLRTVLLVGENEVVPLPQQGTSAGTGCAVEILCLGNIGALNCGLEVLEGTIGDVSEDGGSRGL